MVGVASATDCESNSSHCCQCQVPEGVCAQTTSGVILDCLCNQGDGSCYTQGTCICQGGVGNVTCNCEGAAPIMASESTFVRYPYLSRVSSLQTMIAKSQVPDAARGLIDVVNNQLRSGISNGGVSQRAIRDGAGNPIGILAVAVTHASNSLTVKFDFYHYTELKSFSEMKDTGIKPEESLTVRGTNWKLEREGQSVDSGQIPAYKVVTAAMRKQACAARVKEYRAELLAKNKLK
jgi:hypothetical protein